jgi:hypothetical protein
VEVLTTLGVWVASESCGRGGPPPSPSGWGIGSRAPRISPGWHVSTGVADAANVRAQSSADSVSIPRKLLSRGIVCAHARGHQRLAAGPVPTTARKALAQQLARPPRLGAVGLRAALATPQRAGEPARQVRHPRHIAPHPQPNSSRCNPRPPRAPPTGGTGQTPLLEIPPNPRPPQTARARSTGVIPARFHTVAHVRPSYRQ